jgi:23S rRNA-/tRNA-specific pseudouridylate synthase
MNIRVLYEDAHLLAVSKPAGVLTHEPSGEIKKKKRRATTPPSLRRWFVSTAPTV